MRYLDATRAGVHLRVSIDVFSLAVNGYLSLNVLVVFERVVDSKSIWIDSTRLPLTDCEEESQRRIIRGFRRDGVPVIAATVSECENRRLVLGVGSSTASRKTTRPRVVLVTFQSSSDVELVNLDRATK